MSDADNVIRRLMYWRDLPKGAPLPTFMGGPAVNTWDDLIRTVCGDAINEIKALRREVELQRIEVTNLRHQLGYEGQSFRDIKAKVGA